MKLLVVTCFTGDKSDIAITRGMLTDLVNSMKAVDGLTATISVMAQDVRGKGFKPDGDSGFAWHVQRRMKNLGFARGMNDAYHMALLALDDRPDFVLCINNDIRMPSMLWLYELFQEAEDAKVLCPTTNFTGTKEQQAKGPEDRAPFYHGVTPAVCWLLPWSACMRLGAHYRAQKLFREDFGPAWGEDNYACAVLRSHDPQPFKIVPKAWIHHIGSVTSSRVSAMDRIRAVKRATQAIKEEGLPPG